MMEQAENGALMYSVSQLSRETECVLADIGRSGKQAFITRRGRFVAVITPLAPGRVESQVLPEMARKIADRASYDLAVQERDYARTQVMDRDAEIALLRRRLKSSPGLREYTAPVETGEPFRSAAEAEWDASRGPER